MPVGGAEWYKEQPTNRNFLNPIGFILKLEKFEGVDFFCQSANLPDINMPTTQVASQFRNLPIIPGGGVLNRPSANSAMNANPRTMLI